MDWSRCSPGPDRPYALLSKQASSSWISSHGGLSIDNGGGQFHGKKASRGVQNLSGVVAPVDVHARPSHVESSTAGSFSATPRPIVPSSVTPRPLGPSTASPRLNRSCISWFA